MKPIDTPSDYNDPERKVVKFAFAATGTLPVEEVTSVSNEARRNVGPQAGCAVVLDNCSIREESLYEISGLNVSKTLGFYGVTAFGFCDADNIDQVRTDWERVSQQILDEQIESLSSAMENAKTLRRSIG